jgi:hypothetical protein
MSSLRCRVIAAGITAVVMAATAGSALAATTDPVVTAIKSQDQALKASGKIQELVGKNFNTPAEAKQAEPEVKAVVAKLDHAADVVAKAQAPTSQDKLGQKDWVTAIRGLGTGFSQLGVAFRDLAAGNKTGARSEVQVALKTINAAGKLGTKADKLLGIS